jgi:hypothetical protein
VGVIDGVGVIVGVTVGVIVGVTEISQPSGHNVKSMNSYEVDGDAVLNEPTTNQISRVAKGGIA